MTDHPTTCETIFKTLSLWLTIFLRNSSLLILLWVFFFFFFFTFYQIIWMEKLWSHVRNLNLFDFIQQKTKQKIDFETYICRKLLWYIYMQTPEWYRSPYIFPEVSKSHIDHQNPKMSENQKFITRLVLNSDLIRYEDLCSSCWSHLVWTITVFLQIWKCWYTAQIPWVMDSAWYTIDQYILFIDIILT